MSQTNHFNASRKQNIAPRMGDPPPASPSNTTVAVGILHSLSGTMAIGEPSLKNAALMAIAEINQAGGVLGKRVEPIIADGASDPAIFAREAQTLIQERHAVTLFGCWTSATRKAVIPVLEKHNILLWYPVQYEGLEESPYVFYTGSCPNQQIVPAVRWLLSQNRKQFYLIGSDYVFPRTIHKIVRAQLEREGGSCLGEQYLPLGATNFEAIAAFIAQVKPDVVLNALNGDSNIAFYKHCKAAGLDPQDTPILAVSVAEEELRRIGEAAVGHYASWSYFQSLSSPENQTFTRNFQARYGSEQVTSDPIEAAYTQVYLWKQAVETAQSFESDRVRQAACNLALRSPGGPVRLDANHHLWKPCRIGQVLPSGQFEGVWDSGELIQPQPWLGVETWNSPNQPIVIDLLAEVSQGIHHSCQLEEKTRALNLWMVELLRVNQQLRQTQQRLTASQKRYREAQDREKLLKKRLSSQIRSSLNLKTILAIAVEEIANLLNLDCCQFLWYRKSDSERPFQPSACAALDPSFCHLDTSTAFRALESQIFQVSCLAVEDINRDPQLDPARRKSLQEVGLRAFLAVPVQTRSGQNGVIVCEQYQQPRNWKVSEVELLKAVVDQLAIAIDQAQLYEQTQTAAAVSQARATQLEAALHNLKETQGQLVQTEKMSALGMSLAGIAHEIKNPIGFICGNLEYLRDYTGSILEMLRLYAEHYPQPPRAIQDYAEEVELDFLRQDLPKLLSSTTVGAERIRDLVLSLRNFSRKDRDRMERVDLHDGIESTLLILSNRLKANGPRPAIEIVKDYALLPPVECYPSQINQVLMNLLGNAIDVLEEMPEGYAGKIIIRTEYRTGDPSLALVRIIDNGSGISPNIRDSLFEPFCTTKPIGKGTGLGLAISRKITVETHGGQLSCRSSPEGGTEFAIALPICRVALTPADEKAMLAKTLQTQR
ncbi:MAG: urea ABC transporter substrate-binding protein [Cyanobacteriota bacterium]|nr:urea ABC transporter substrate-binding protein [Cyanobacteriota bacterium]